MSHRNQTDITTVTVSQHYRVNITTISQQYHPTGYKEVVGGGQRLATSNHKTRPSSSQRYMDEIASASRQQPNSKQCNADITSVAPRHHNRTTPGCHGYQIGITSKSRRYHISNTQYHVHIASVSLRYHIGITTVANRYHINITTVAHRYHINITTVSHRYHIGITTI